MNFIRSAVGIVLAIIIFIVSWVAINAIVGLRDFIQSGNELYNKLGREILSPGVAAYIAIYGTDKIIKEDKRYTFYSLSIFIVIFTIISIVLMIRNGQQLDVLDFVIQLLTPIAVIVGAFLASKDDFGRS